MTTGLKEGGNWQGNENGPQVAELLKDQRRANGCQLCQVGSCGNSHLGHKGCQCRQHQAASQFGLSLIKQPDGIRPQDSPKFLLNSR